MKFNIVSNCRLNLNGDDYVVLDVSGKEITRGEGHQQTTINCNDWHKGTCFITVNQNGSLQTSQLIKVD